MSSPMSTAARNTEFWQKARRAGSPLKIFIQPGSAVPPSAWEESGGWYGYDEQKRFLADDLSVTSLDEVMDWPSVWNPDNPGYARMWGMIGATFEMRGVVEGHGSGLTDPHDISAFAAAGLSSDHEVWALDEAWDRLMRGIFVELRPFSYDAIIPGLIERGLKDWSNVAFTTDDRSASETPEDRRVRPQCAPRDRTRPRVPRSPSSAPRSTRLVTCASTSGSARSRPGATPISCCSTMCRRFRSRTSLPTDSWSSNRQELCRAAAFDRLAGLGDEDHECRAQRSLPPTSLFRPSRAARRCRPRC